MSELNIYKASAGSGKTYQLTGEYLKLLFEDLENFKHILAVTFTNKATDEMKSRILKEVYTLSIGGDSGYREDLMNQFGLSIEAIKKKAKTMLFKMLHNYSWFSVTTIDSFFQKIVRSFARETGLQAGFNLEIDQDKVLNSVCDNLLNGLKDDKNLQKWLTDYAKEKVGDGKSWNLKESISVLSKEIFKEDYKQFNDKLLEKLQDKNFLTEYKTSLENIAKRFEEYMHSRAKLALDLIDAQGLRVEDFSYGKSGVANYFRKAMDNIFEPTKRAYDAAGDSEKWTAKKASQEIKIKIEGITGQLMSIINDMIDYHTVNHMKYNSLNLVLKNIHTLGVLTDISKQIRSFAQEENIFLLSDSAQLLNSIIGDNHSPFLYEKLGNNYKHYMIDEFQDTSSMQWTNFKPLIENSLAEGHYGLIVGDVKQSIYRWRNGDWNLLDHKVEEEFGELGHQVHTLDNNWRSKTNIINYNNSIFHYCPIVLQDNYNNSMPAILHEHLSDQREQIKNAYATAYQDIPKGKVNKEGNVKHYYFSSDKDETFADKALEQLPKTIKDLQESGYKANDIAILVRRAKDGVMVADKLMECKAENTDENIVYDFISNESLYLQNSSAIKLITSAIMLLLNQENEIFKKAIAYEYLYYQKKDNKLSEATYENLPKEFTEHLESLRRMPLYELSENLIQIFKLEENKDFFPYLQAFQDMLADYCNQNGSDISLFMDWWDEHKDKKVISVSENQEAIKILTIHKSKGLEFKAVIIPFLEWPLNNEAMGSILWCEPKDEDIKALDVIPVKYGKSLESSLFYEEYYQEKLKTYIDNLNLLYVAFTRAEHDLISFSPRPKEGKANELKKISDLLLHIYQNSNQYAQQPADKHYTDLSKGWDGEDYYYELIGEEVNEKEEEHTNSAIPLEKYTSELLGNRLKHRFHSEEYFDFDEKEDINEFAPISRGNLIHSVFEYIITLDDVDKAISKLIVEGKISTKQSVSIKQEIEKLLNNEQIRDWFSGEWEIMAERDIMTSKGHIFRPDRIMIKGNKAVIIDYKSGKEKLKDYNKKMYIYCNTVKRLGFKEVQGYIWYLRDNTLEEVK